MSTEDKKIEYISVNIDGVIYDTLLTNKYSKRKNYTDPNPNMVLAFIPGTIIEVLKQEKDNVKEGEVIVILEAMKMLNKVIAPIDGKVTFKIAKNDIVKNKQPLFEII